MAFTLIELLVVVAIISLLVSLLLPSLTKAKDLAKLVMCLSNLRQINVGMRYYVDDSKEEYPPWIVTYYSYRDRDGVERNPNWGNFLCGQQETGIVHTAYLPAKDRIFGTNTVLVCPMALEFNSEYVNFTNYGANAFRFNGVWSPGAFDPTPWLTDQSLTNPQQKVEVYCSANYFAGGSARHSDWLSTPRFWDAHDSEVPILWFDGHADAEGKEVVEPEDWNDLGGRW